MKPSVKELIESATGGLTFRKTFTPQPPPMPPALIHGKQQVKGHNHGSGNHHHHQHHAVNDKKIFDRFCDLFGKEASEVKRVLDSNAAKAAADVLGYAYNQPPTSGEESPQVKPASGAKDEQDEIRDRLMREIKEKISERRRRILQQTHVKRLAPVPTPTTPNDDDDQEQQQQQQKQQKQSDDGYEKAKSRDLWTAIPAIADPDNADSSFDEEERNRWDPDAAFMEVERILESLEQSVTPMDERRATGDDDKHSDDSGMSSSADTSNCSASSSSCSGEPPARRPEVIVKPVRKSKQQQQVVAPHGAQEEDEEDAAAPAAVWNRCRYEDEFHIYSVTHDSPSVIIDSASDSSSDRRVRLDGQSSSAPAATVSLPTSVSLPALNSHHDQQHQRRRSVTLTRSAGEMFGSLRSNLSAGASSTNEAINRLAQRVSDNILRPIAETVGEAGTGIAKAAEPIVTHLQVLGTRLQVRYMYAAQNKHWLPQFPAADWLESIPKSQNGFDELRLHVKEGGDLCKELSSILQERSELEASYAKGLAKLASKLVKTTGELQGPHGTVTAGWTAVAQEMESQAELHKSLAVTLAEDLVKPLKISTESQYRVRKAVEAGVDKTGRVLAEWRSAQAKAKKQCYLTARDNEKVQDQVFVNKPRALTDKETAKLENKCKKTQDALRKAEGEYYTCCTRAERARLDWESSTNRGGRCFHALEQERLTQLKDLLGKYYICLRDYCPKVCQAVERLSDPVAAASVESDLHRIEMLRDSAPAYGEQILPDFYAEHMSNVMNRERRKESLERCLHWVRSDVERESRGRRGVENLAKALQEAPHFGGEESQLEVHEKLVHLRSMLAFFEITRVKLHNACSELEPNRYRKVDHPLFKYLEVHKDKQALMQSVLKLPHWIENEDIEIEMHEDGRGTGDGNSGQPDSDFDEFSSQDSDGEVSSHSVIHAMDSNRNAPVLEKQVSVPSSVAPSVGKCRALYSYAANMYDELSIEPGDVINIHDKQADGWWLGELGGTIGIFPATYVEEV